MSKSSSSAPSQRMLRVGEQVRAAITQVLQRGEIRDPILSNTLISVTEVRMSPDLTVATAYVTPLGVEDHTDTITALNKNAKFIRGRVSPDLRQMRTIPELRFRDDTSFANYQHIDQLLKSPEVARDLGHDDAASSDGDGSSDGDK
ncbi:MAG: 30S ribosome-binding factor RbfA [Hoeflea sp.]|uniref:30S ribosome-binding factor RbfA n=1 Tax=Hoeflea sp. TaxID=1940281 RepID=UPI001D3756C5|nr:30S ribosome-binding factor RbfA [Hoeflea sp.]MBU4531517.1 30S ribosome-binding factor RbfA [Alphaproteobacteria bacterium]MBU4544374.1 30S ribosome-binding factor RbfA [Alphaproteobacteria bacterium]MBU4550389.1 30S ribosome-binding factor RbfA [Alphaproteobacteria bacterium]MBV1724793.1 30S ribosome-binding factor RbfA [Hoeflea sp.]MBV1760813.1 30S ribosome-binding factor RbfA [Hoeflea sp.]